MTRTAAIQTLTASRLLLALAITMLLVPLHDHDAARWTAVVLMIAMEVTDLLDGVLARRWKVVTKFGKVFDPYADSVAHLLVYWSLAVTGYVWLLVVLVLAVRDISVAYVRSLLALAGRDASARWIGKAKAAVHGVLAIFVVFVGIVLPAYSDWLVAPVSIVVILFTVAAMLDHLIAAWPTITRLEE